MSGDGATVRSILKDIGEDLLWRKQGELVKCREQNDDFNSCSVRFTVGKEGCKVKNHGWVPDRLGKIGLPENVGTFGAPWLHHVPCGTVLNSPEDLPYSGFGQFVIGMHGAVWLICWPGKYATDIAMSLNRTFDNVGIGTPNAHRASPLAELNSLRGDVVPGVTAGDGVSHADDR
ncbi:MAG: hypothetical protein GY809_15445, partial [Planctomycetes bacterium]|nr:hypothetical protein [Planctomycetota bacterium]